MSEFIAEARVLIRPDTTVFRRELERELAAITAKPVTIPVRTQVVGTANEALSQNTAQLNANAVAAERNAVATQTAGAAKVQAATATKTLTAADTAAATAAQKLAIAQGEVVGAASAESAAQVRLTRSLAAVAAAESALDKALKSKNASLIIAGEGSLAAARDYAVEAEAALFAARAEAAHARTLDAVGTAGIANTASLLGLRGAVLTAGAAFLGATVAFQAASKSIKAAVDTTEELNKSVEVFGTSSQQIKDFASTTATSLGISNVEALRATGIFGNLFRSINIGAPAAAEMSETLVRLAADLASFNNADPSQVLDNLRSGLAGEAEPLRKFGIFLSEARVQQEALANTGKKSVQQLTQQEKVQARFNLILRDSVIASGDFERTSGSVANQTRILTAQVQDLGAQLGSAVLPALKTTVTALNEYVRSVKTAIDATVGLGKSLRSTTGDTGPFESHIAGAEKAIAKFYFQAVLLGPVLTGISVGTKLLGDRSRETAVGVANFAAGVHAAGRAAATGALNIATLANALKDVQRVLTGLEVENLEIQTGLAPGGRAALIANLQDQIEGDKEAVAAAASGSKARRLALEELKRDQAALAAIQQEIASEAEDSARDAKSAAEKAARAQEEADQAFLDLLGRRREDQDRRVARAADTTGLQDDIRAQNNLQRLIQQQIAKIRDRIKDEQKRKDAIRALRIALIASREEERKLRQQQAQQQAEQVDTVQQLNIDIAIEKGNKAAAERAIQARINRLNKQIKAAKGDQVKVKQLILERERLRNQLKELREEEDKGREDARKQAARFFFEQLQAQQGFASNLLGNLITGPTAGLVGNPAPSPAVNIQAQATAAQGRAQTGVTGGQAEKQSFILQKILLELRKLNGSYDAPEAIHQKKVGAAGMDYTVL